MIALLLTDPYAIFAQARERWESARYPSQIAYDVAVNVTHAGVSSSAHYHLYYDAQSNNVRVNPVSDEELAHPYTPHGMKFGLFGGAIPLGSPEHTFDYLGVPSLAPNYSFGIAPYVAPRAMTSEELVREIRSEFHDPAKKPQQTGSSLPTIATVDVVRRRYVIDLNGITTIDGHSDYDLRLQPVRDPATYRLREVWINTQDFATDRLAAQGNFTYGGMTSVPWTVDFRDVGGAPYIASESTRESFKLDRRAYDTATITFADVRIGHMPPYMGIATFSSGEPPLTEPQP